MPGDLPQDDPKNLRVDILPSDTVVGLPGTAPTVHAMAMRVKRNGAAARLNRSLSGTDAGVSIAEPASQSAAHN